MYFKRVVLIKGSLSSSDRADKTCWNMFHCCGRSECDAIHLITRLFISHNLKQSFCYLSLLLEFSWHVHLHLLSSFWITKKQTLSWTSFRLITAWAIKTLSVCNSKWLPAQTRWFENNNSGILAGAGNKRSLIRAGHGEIDVETAERFSHLFVSSSFSISSPSQHPPLQSQARLGYSTLMKIRKLTSLQAVFYHAVSYSIISA